jgi:hypothetical protein
MQDRGTAVRKHEKPLLDKGFEFMGMVFREQSMAVVVYHLYRKRNSNQGQVDADTDEWALIEERYSRSDPGAPQLSTWPWEAR